MDIREDSQQHDFLHADLIGRIRPGLRRIKHALP
jgi:hypothetical protein